MNRTQKITISCTVLALTIAAISSFILYKEQTRSYLTVSFLKIGQGDSIFIEAPNGNQILIDGGPTNSVIQELSAVMPFYDRSIDMVFATHPDNDHIGGLPDVFQRYQIGRLVRTEVAASSSTYTEFNRQILERKIPVTYARRGQSFVLDQKEEIYLDILFPDRDVQLLETNTASIVAMLRHKKVSVLLTGDAPKGVEKFLAEVDVDHIATNILKLGHHGSHTSSDEIFLKATKPDLAVVSAGKDNRYGHPHKDIIERLERLGIPYTTTLDERRVFQSNGEVIRESIK